MRILVVGATGTIGKAVVEALSRGNELVEVTRHSDIQADITQLDSIAAMYRAVGKVDAIVSAAGGAAWKPLAELTNDDFTFSLANKLMGQVNLIRSGFESVRDGGSITITSGYLAQHPMIGSAAVSLVNSALEGFARAAALEAPRAIRVNIVSPPWVSETLTAMGGDPSTGLPASAVAEAYVRSVTGKETGQVIEPQRRRAQSGFTSETRK